MMPFHRTWVYFLFTLSIVCCGEKEKAEKEITELRYTPIGLDDLDEFDAADAKSWRVVSDINFGRRVPGALDVDDGQGILLFPKADGQSELVTKLQHEDIDIKIDFMLSAGAEARLILQGRYPLLLQDNWSGKGNAKQDCGVILTPSDSAVQPLLNAAKAPGLWQHLTIKYQAPRFSTTGKKISHAVFKEVVLNDKLIHQNVYLEESRQPDSALPTTKGPIKIIASNGPLAFRNFEYKAYNDLRATLKNVTYQVYKGLYKEYDTLNKLTAYRSGTADSLHWKYGDKRAQISFDGKISIPVEGEYLFKLRAGGPAWLIIDDVEVVNNRNTREYTMPYYGVISLLKGDHDLKIVYANYDESLVVEYAGPGIPLTVLTTPSSERKIKPFEPFEYVVEKIPAVQRGFATHKGKVNTYSVAVGLPGGVNYLYDLTRFSPLAVWRGKFIDVSNMWTERGESQLQIPLGAPLELPGAPGLLKLSTQDQVWTDTVSIADNIYTKRGYRLNENGVPIFFYMYGNVAVEDRLMINSDTSGLERTVSITFKETENDLYFLLGSGKDITRLGDGDYVVADKEYFIGSLSGVSDRIKVVNASNDRSELLLPLEGKAGQKITFHYSIIW